MPWWIIDVRRNYSGVCARWRPVVLGLHRFFIAIARVVVNHDGGAGTSVDPLVWSVGSAPVVHAVRDRAFQQGPAGIWDGCGSLLLRLQLPAMTLSFGQFC